MKTELRIHENGNEKDYKRIVINIDDLKKNSENIQDPLDCLKNHIRLGSSKLVFQEPYFIFETILYFFECNRSFDRNKSSNFPIPAQLSQLCIPYLVYGNFIPYYGHFFGDHTRKLSRISRSTKTDEGKTVIFPRWHGSQNY